MKTDFIGTCCNFSHKSLSNLQKGVYLCKCSNNRTFIIKAKTGGFIGRLRHVNEYRFYQKHKFNFENLRIPKFFGICPEKSLVLEYVQGKEFIKIPAKVLIPAYKEFQNIKANSTSLFNYIFSLLRGFFYRICIVSVLSLGRRIQVLHVFKIVLLYSKLNIRQRKFNTIFRMHGDLYCSNMIKNSANELVLIDFENTFFTKKWPLAELTSLSFYFDDKNLQFSPNYLLEYLQQCKSELKNHLEREQCLKRQIRFGILQHSIGQIVQTKGNLKKETYLNLLEIVLDKTKFENWFESYISSELNKM